MTRWRCSAEISGPRSDSGRQAGAEAEGPGKLRDSRDDRLEHVVVDEQPRARHAVLALQEKGAARGAWDHPRQVGIREDDEGRLAAEFQRHTLEVAGCRQQDLPAHFGRAGEGNLVDTVMRRERGAGIVTIAGDDVDDAVGNAALPDDLAEQQRRHGRELRGLQYHGAAGGECRRQLQHRHDQGRVPGHDGADHAD
jgi:hypothetical protein